MLHPITNAVSSTIRLPFNKFFFNRDKYTNGRPVNQNFAQYYCQRQVVECCRRGDNNISYAFRLWGGVATTSVWPVAREGVRERVSNYCITLMRCQTDLWPISRVNWLVALYCAEWLILYIVILNLTDMLYNQMIKNFHKTFL